MSDQGNTLITASSIDTKVIQFFFVIVKFSKLQIYTNVGFLGFYLM